MVVAHYGYLVLKMPSPMAFSGSGETVMQGHVHWRNSRLRQQLVKLLQSLGARTPRHQAHASAARSQHPVCNPLSRKMSP
jgi:hypothetical protein